MVVSKRTLMLMALGLFAVVGLTQIILGNLCRCTRRRRPLRRFSWLAQLQLTQ